MVKWCLDLGSDRKLLRIPKLSGFSGTSEFHLGLYWKYIIYMVEPDIASINTEPQRQQKSSTNVSDLQDIAIIILANSEPYVMPTISTISTRLGDDSETNNVSMMF